MFGALGRGWPCPRDTDPWMWLEEGHLGVEMLLGGALPCWGGVFRGVAKGSWAGLVFEGGFWMGASSRGGPGEQERDLG